MTDISHLRGHVEILQYCKAEKARLKEIEDGAKAIIMEALAGAEEGAIGGETVVTYKRIESKRLDQSALKSRFPEVYEMCRTVTESRRFEVS